MAYLAVEQGAKIILGRVTKINYSEDPKSVVSVTYSANRSTTELEATDVNNCCRAMDNKSFPTS